ncbi:hypothetical protein GA0115252_11601, partial [Streptomyces sp. DfronAA-171]
MRRIRFLATACTAFALLTAGLATAAP